MMDSNDNLQPTTSNAPPTTQYQRAPTATRAGARRPLSSPSTRHLLEQKSSEEEDLQGMTKSTSMSQLDDVEVKDDRPRTPTLTGPIIELRGREVIFAIGVFFLVAIVVGLIVVLASDKVNEMDGIEQGPQSELLKGCAQCPKMLKHYKEEAEKYCITPQCVGIAARILENMDQTVDPCVDFWQYACGGWLARTEIPSTLDAWGMDDEITMKVRMKVKRIMESPVLRNETESAERKFKIFYSKCMDTRGMEESGVTPFLNMVDEFGGWALLCRNYKCFNHSNPRSWHKIVQADWNLGEKSGRWKVQTALEILHFNYDIDAFFGLVVQRDDNDSSVNIISFDQGGLTLSDRSDYLRDEKSSLIAAYKSYLTKIASLFNATQQECQLFAESVFRVEKHIAILHEDENSDRRQNPREMYNKLTVNDLQSIAPRINWKTFLRVMYNSTEGETEIITTNPQYLGNISELIRTLNESDLNNYFVWQLFHKFAAPHLTNDIADAYASFRKAMRSSPQLCDKPERRRQSHVRQAFCQKQTNDWFGNAVAAQFVQGNTTTIEKEVEVMIGNIKDAFKKTLRTCWLDSDTVPAALDKLEKMKAQIGYPKFIMNHTSLDEYYKGLEVDENLSFFDNILLAKKYERNQRKKALEKNDLTEDWSMNPTEVNAFYSFAENTVGFTAGLLQEPYYDTGFPRYVSYATLGSAVAHEITHAFDRAGAMYDKDGNLRKWWSDKSWDNFVARTYCIDDYYHTLRVKGVEGEIDNSETINENIADIGGLKHAFKAYKYWREDTLMQEKLLPIPGLDLTNERVFFITFAQNWCKSRRTESLPGFIRRSEHALEEFRVKGTVAQNSDFATAFKCKPGSEMNPSHKCSIW